MINTIIFDFGDIFIDLNPEKAKEAFAKLGLNDWNDDLKAQNSLFEIGKLSELQFLESFQKYIPNADLLQIRAAWNSLIGDFPLRRLEFLQMLTRKYRLFLLSNTDAIHIAHFEHKVGMSFASDFYQCFEKVYFSYEVGIRKPDEAFFKLLIKNHNLSEKRTLFVDDKKINTDAAEKLGIQVWNLHVGQEDVVDLNEKKIL
jgi:glucose-1-phosphatase